MIINTDKVKTEALLIFCRDLISSYKDAELIVDVQSSLKQKISIETDLTISQINKVIKPNAFYINNRNNFKIKAIFNCYEFLKHNCETYFHSKELFNPSMLFFSFLTFWFAELEKEKNSKEYIFFNIYPFCEIYDEFLINTKNHKYKILNLKMVEIAENIILAYNQTIIKF